MEGRRRVAVVFEAHFDGARAGEREARAVVYRDTVAAIETQRIRERLRVEREGRFVTRDEVALINLDRCVVDGAAAHRYGRRCREDWRRVRRRRDGWQAGEAEFAVGVGVCER